jgi:hypothetical protein
LIYFSPGRSSTVGIGQLNNDVMSCCQTFAGPLVTKAKEIVSSQGL